MNAIDLQGIRGKRIAVGLSGGVDSSTVLALLHEAGAAVFGLAMIVANGDDPDVARRGCAGPGQAESIAYSRALCESLGVPYYSFDLSAEYQNRIVSYFKGEYSNGRTPNPCIRCNPELKFGFLLDKALDSGIRFDYFATGHYARIENRRGVPTLRRAVDESKDQSYFLHRLSVAQLARSMFPLGVLSKAQVRAEAS
ncbi:MAG: tRNA 2-thiouridine(34) synthase MnmA, partial [Spirochaetales bacterium]|nr:tRNA 2-thiouridine(34) synthase MnmA [Spirochaetales bacterium]